MQKRRQGEKNKEKRKQKLSKLSGFPKVKPTMEQKVQPELCLQTSNICSRKN